MKKKIYEMLRKYVAKRATHNLGEVEITEDEVICYVDGKKLKKQMLERDLHRYNIRFHRIPTNEEIYKVYKLNKPVHYIIKDVDFDREINIMASMKDCHVTFEKCSFTACIGIDFADHITFKNNIYRAQTYKNYYSIHKDGTFCISTRADKNEINKIEFIQDKIKVDDVPEVPFARANDTNKSMQKKMEKAVMRIWLYGKEVTLKFSDIVNAKSIEMVANNLTLISSGISAKETEIKTGNINFVDSDIKSDVITIDSSTIEGKLLISHNGLFINGVEVDKNEAIIIDNYDISLQQNRLELIDLLKKIENKSEEEISMQIKSQPLKRILKK